MKYGLKEYKRYVRDLKDSFPEAFPVSFEEWKELQPCADKAVGLCNRILKIDQKVSEDK